MNLSGLHVPRYVYEMLARGPKHPVRDQFREMHFLEDMDQILAQIPAEESVRKNEINALIVQYNNRKLKQNPDKSVDKVNRYLKKENVKAVAIDKGAGFCLLRSEQYGERLTDIL